MVLWCRDCNALLGVREPISNWATDRNSLCAACVEEKRDQARRDRKRDERNESPRTTDQTESP